MKKINKFLKSKYYKLMQQAVIMLLSLVLASCAAVQAAQPQLPAMANSGQISVIEIKGLEVIHNMSAGDVWYLVKPGSTFQILSYIRETGRVFIFISNGEVLRRGLMVGLDRTQELLTMFVRDGYRLAPSIGSIPMSVLRNLPMVTIFVMPVGTDFTPWIPKQVAD